MHVILLLDLHTISAHVKRSSLWDSLRDEQMENREIESNAAFSFAPFLCQLVCVRACVCVCTVHQADSLYLVNTAAGLSGRASVSRSEARPLLSVLMPPVAACAVNQLSHSDRYLQIIEHEVMVKHSINSLNIRSFDREQRITPDIIQSLPLYRST